MNSRRISTAVRLLILIMCSAALLALYSPTASALMCTDIGGVEDVNGNCTLSADYDCTADTTITITGDFTIDSSGSIQCNGDTDQAGFDLTISVGGGMIVDGIIRADGGVGSAGSAGSAGNVGKNAGIITITVGGDMVINNAISAAGGAGGNGGTGSGNGSGGPGNNGGNGGQINMSSGTYLLSITGSLDVASGPGGAGGAGGTIGGSGNAGGDAGTAGTINISSCETTITGLVAAAGGAGGTGGAGGVGGAGGNNGAGGPGGNITLESGRDLRLGSDAVILATGGNEGQVGTGTPPGGDVSSGGNGGAITTNHCPDFALIDNGALLSVAGGFEDGINGIITNLSNRPCCSCQVVITKTVAVDNNCDGTPDGPFLDSAVQDDGECVVYQICVRNTATDGSNVPQTLLDVLVNDSHLGIGLAPFGDIAPGQEVCQFVKSDIPASVCTADPDACVCEEVQGMNTAVVAQAECAITADNACLEKGSECDDTADVACAGCSVDIRKTVARDDDCDGVADGPFRNNVAQDMGECVLYRICVANTGDQRLDATGVRVSDATLGVVNLNFGKIASGAPAVCKVIPVNASASACTTDPDSCECTEVEGTNTAQITSAVCAQTQANACEFAASDCDDTATVDCLTCSVDIDKTVALDYNCDGIADGPFQNSVIQVTDECVVYQICVTSTGEQNLDSTGVEVSDPTLGVVNLNFGTLVSSEMQCREIPTDASARACTTDPDSCVCSEVEGKNTATVTAASCEVTGSNACDFAVSDCEDTAKVTCGPGCLTRTPDYWGNHPGETADFLPLTSCGITIETFGQAVQDLCVDSVDAESNGIPMQDLALIRQCTAAMLNLSATAFFGGNCEEANPTNASVLDMVASCCGDLCSGGLSGKAKKVKSRCIENLEFFNNFSKRTDPLDTMQLCPNERLGTEPPCVDSGQCEEASGDGIINPRP